MFIITIKSIRASIESQLKNQNSEITTEAETKKKLFSQLQTFAFDWDWDWIMLTNYSRNIESINFFKENATLRVTFEWILCQAN